MTKSVAIVILNWNGINDTKDLLRSISFLSLTSIDCTVIIVDNASTDGSYEFLSTYQNVNHKTVFIRNDSNLGFADGNNVGISKALELKCEYIILVNNDIVVSKNLVIQLVKVAEYDQAVSMVSPKIFFAPGFEFHKALYTKSDLGRVIWYAGGKIDWNNVYTKHIGVDKLDQGQFDKQQETDFASGACVLIKAETVKRIGFLDGRYYLYWEDIDYSIRARRSGGKIVYTSTTHVWHKVSKSSGIGSDLNDYFLTRNRMLFGIKYSSFKTKLALIRESLRLLFKGRKWQRIAIRDFYLLRFGKGSWV